MKKHVSFLIVFFFTFSLHAKTKTIVIEYPQFNATSTNWVEVVKIELKSKETVIHFNAFSQRIFIDNNAHIMANGKRYNVKSANGIELNQWIESSDHGGVISASLSFASIPKGTKTLDFHETGTSVWGLQLTPTSDVASETIVVRNPPFSVANSANIEVSKIEISDKETVVYFKAFCNQIYVDKSTHIVAGGKKYPVKSASGMALESWVESNNYGGLITASLHFDAIPKETETLDFHETGTSIWGIELKSDKLSNRAELPLKVKDYTIDRSDTSSLQAQGFKKGTAILKGQFLGFRPELNNLKISVYLNNPITGIQESYKTETNESGEFELSIPLVSSMQVLFRVEGNIWMNEEILLSPDDTSFVYFDLEQKFCQEARLRRDKCSKSQWIYFSGANADMNNQFFEPSFHQFRRNSWDYSQIMEDIAGMSSGQYRDYLLAILKQNEQSVTAFNLTPKAIDLFNIINKHQFVYYLTMGKYFLGETYQKSQILNNTLEKEGQKGNESHYTPPVFDLNYYKPLKDVALSSSKNLYSLNYSDAVNECRYIFHDLQTERTFNISIETIVNYLKETNSLKPEDFEFAEKIVSLQNNNFELSEDDQKKMRTELPALLNEAGEIAELSDRGKELIKEIGQDIESDLTNLQETAFKVKDLVFTFEDKKVFSDVKAKLHELCGSIYSLQNDLNNFIARYNDQVQNYFNQTQRKLEQESLFEIFETNEGLLFDLIATQSASRKLEESTPLSDKELAAVVELGDPFYYEYLKTESERIELANKMKREKGGFNAYTLPETDDEKIMYEILKPFEGNIILVDFWETWCGPCRSAMTQFEPSKEKLKEQGIVFVYIASESSPKDSWDNMLTGIAGEHYRVTTAQMDYLKEKFGIRGVPSYLIYDKNGEQIFFQTGFNQMAIERVLNEAIERVLNEVLKK